MSLESRMDLLERQRALKKEIAEQVRDFINDKPGLLESVNDFAEEQLRGYTHTSTYRDLVDLVMSDIIRSALAQAAATW